MRQIKGFIESIEEGGRIKTIRFAGGLTTSNRKFDYRLDVNDETIKELLRHHATPKRGTLTYDLKGGVIMISAGSSSIEGLLTLTMPALEDLAIAFTVKKKGPGNKGRDLLKELGARKTNTPITLTIGTPKKSTGSLPEYNNMFKNVELGIIFNDI